MKVPLSWLQEYVAFDLAPAALAERLTYAGLEVEKIEQVGADFKGIVVGEILSRRPVARAKALWLCEVSNGASIRRVVCGAPNGQVGDKVPLAEIGATLPNGQLIAAATIRGEPSEGMLCAEDELGLSDDHSGLLILPPETPAGTPLATVLGPPETVLTLEITPNRPDCLSLLGIAREVAALTGQPWQLPEVAFPETGPAITSGTALQVDDPEGCPRYTARLLTQIAIAPSPFRMRRRLILAGIRPINNIVDITNYVMLECGQPLHAFDQKLLAEGRIIVRRARSGERLVMLDESEQKLSPDLLVIADAQQPVACAGIMGGAASGITPTTTEVLLESAHFKPALIRQGSKLLGLTTESSYRFERGTDINLPDWASRRATSLMVQAAGAVVAKGCLDAYPQPPKPRRLTCRFGRVRQLLGLEIAPPTICRIFEALALPVVQRDPEACTVEAPSFRTDLDSEAALIEEIARIHGLEHIPVHELARGVSRVEDRAAQALSRCREHLVGLGLSEIMNYSFVSTALLDPYGSESAAHSIALPRPLSSEHARLRPWLLPQMIETLGRNRSRQIAEAMCFEIGRVFFKDNGKLQEEERLAIGLMGPVGRAGMEKQRALAEEDSFAWLKGILLELATALGWEAGPQATQALSLSVPAAEPPPGFAWDCFRAPALVIKLDGAACGVLGLMNAEIRRQYRIPDPLAALELRLAPLLRHIWRTPTMVPLPMYPAVTRDIAICVGPGIKHAAIIRALWKTAPRELTNIELFDIYKGTNLGVGHQSMAYSLTYRATDRTLTDEEVNALHATVKAVLRDELKAEIREG